jgi:acylphosphatase
MPGRLPQKREGEKRVNIRAHLLITGRVQGVFFREHTRRWAGERYLHGWIQNLPDGRVEVSVEGEKENIIDLIGRLRQGSPLSRVDDIEVSWQDFRNEFSMFRIRS